MTIREIDKSNEIKLAVLENLVQKDHMVRKLDKYLNLDFVYDKVKDSYC
ncbi:hypothetical protein [Alkaliphilus crotonatoxidans]